MPDSDNNIQQDHRDGVPEGTDIGGVFRIEKRIAAGGMGEVYRAHNIHNEDDIVAIKIVLSELAKDETILSLAKKESSILSKLSHNAIVQYRMFLVDKELDRPCLVMEFVDGESLGKVMKRSPFSAEAIHSFLKRIAEGLANVHDEGVIHRDLSPDNIILTGGRIDKSKIIDFGIARANDLGKTLLGDKFAGKYNFVAPEQLGLFQGQISPRTDIYSLGLVTVAALQGEPLDMTGGGTPVDVIEKRQRIPNLDHIDPSLRNLIGWMLQPDPSQRPPSMRAIVEWLQHNPYHNPMQAASVPPVSQPPYSHPPISQPPVSQPPVSQVPVSQTPYSQPPVSQPPYSQPPVSQPPVSQAPVSQPPAPSAFPETVIAPAGTLSQGSAPTGLESFGSPAMPTPPIPEAPQPSTPPTSAPGTSQSGELPAHLRKIQISMPQSTLPPAGGSRGNGSGDEKKGGKGLIVGLLAVLLLGGGAGGAYFGGLFDTSTGAVAPDTKPEPPKPDPAPQPEPDPAPAPTPPKADPAKWVSDFQFGDCFHAAWIDNGTTNGNIVGYSAQKDAFRSFFEAYNKEFGSAPELQPNLLVSKQCPITRFLGGAKSGGSPVAITLANELIQSGQPISGQIQHNPADELHVLLVDHSGIVYNFANFIKEVEGKKGSKSFGLELSLSGDHSEPQPQLIIAISGSQKLEEASLAKPQRARKLFPVLADEMRTSNSAFGIDVGYFRIAKTP